MQSATSVSNQENVMVSNNLPFPCFHPLLKGERLKSLATFLRQIRFFLNFELNDSPDCPLLMPLLDFKGIGGLLNQVNPALFEWRRQLSYIQCGGSKALQQNIFKNLNNHALANTQLLSSTEFTSIGSQEANTPPSKTSSEMVQFKTSLTHSHV